LKNWTAAAGQLMNEQKIKLELAGFSANCEENEILCLEFYIRKNDICVLMKNTRAEKSM
jgi:hypothetical protein